MVFLEKLVFMVDGSRVYTRNFNFFSYDGFHTNLAWISRNF